MSTKILCGLVLLAFVIHTNALLGSKSHWQLKRLASLNKLNNIMLSTLQRPNSKEILDSVQTRYVSQRLDHFNPQDTRYYWQRYYVSTLYWNSATGPVFVYVGGEEELFPGYLVGGKFFRKSLF